MLQLHLNVSLVNKSTQQMLPELVTPLNMHLLLRLLQLAHMDYKVTVIKILDGLRRNKMPKSCFDECAAKLVDSSEYEGLPGLMLKKYLTSPYC